MNSDWGSESASSSLTGRDVKKASPYSYVIYDVITGESWVKGTQELCLLFLVTSYNWTYSKIKCICCCCCFFNDVAHTCSLMLSICETPDFECKPFRDWSLSLLHAILFSGNKKKPHISGVARSGNVPYPYTHSVYHSVTKEITKKLLKFCMKAGGGITDKYRNFTSSICFCNYFSI